MTDEPNLADLARDKLPWLPVSRYRYFTDLDPVFANEAIEALLRTYKAGYVMIPYEGRRSPAEQAKYWRMGRPTAAILKKRDDLKRNGNKGIAQLIDAAGVQKGAQIITGALPMESFHQYNIALDCYYQPDGPGSVDWNSTIPYATYANAANQVGLLSGREFSTPDFPHIQMPYHDMPSQQDPGALDEALAKYGH